MNLIKIPIVVGYGFVVLTAIIMMLWRFIGFTNTDIAQTLTEILVLLAAIFLLPALILKPQEQEPEPQEQQQQ